MRTAAKRDEDESADRVQLGRAAALAFDVAVSDRGIAGLRPGSGRIDAGTRRARALAKRAREELAEYLEGLRSDFTVPFDLSAVTPFQRSVLEATATIPFGEVRSYRWVAETVGSPKAVRAVGTALGRNPVPIVVPCHRVLRSDGSLGGYALGLDLKSRLLRLEHSAPQSRTYGSPPASKESASAG